MTTPPVDNPETLRSLLGEAEALFLDFDGPVCNVFAGLPPSVVVDQLCVVLADGGYGDPPAEIEKSSDPFDVLKYAASLGETEASYVNASFTAHEIEAIATAEPANGANRLIRAWSKADQPLAIVSNNSTIAIKAYLDLHKLSSHVTYIAGRIEADPSLLKPNPHLLRKALAVLGKSAAAAIFVGDSPTDLEAANATDLPFIGYANKTGKLSQFSGADAVVTSMTSLGAVIRSD